MNANESLDEVIAEHKALKSLLSNIQEQFDAPIVNATALQLMIDDARRQIFEHFELEENEFFDSIVAKAPWLKTRADALKSQHEEFRERLDRISSQLEHSTEDTLFDLSREFDSFLVDYFRHEGRENALVQEVFTREIGAKD